MKEKKQNEEEILDRRVFFKQAAKKVLPLLAVTVLGSTILASCEKEEGTNGSSTGCGRSCSGDCDGSCSGSCDTDCSHECSGLCAVNCYGLSY